MNTFERDKNYSSQYHCHCKIYDYIHYNKMKVWHEKYILPKDGSINLNHYLFDGNNIFYVCYDYNIVDDIKDFVITDKKYVKVERIDMNEKEFQFNELLKTSSKFKITPITHDEAYDIYINILHFDE